MAYRNATLGTTSSPLSWLKAPSSALACGALALLLATTALPQHAAAQVTDQQIDDFIKANAGNPDAIAKAMKEHNVDVGRIKKATGASQETIDKYVADSNSEQLREVTRGQTSNTITNQQIDDFIKANANDPDAIAKAMREYNVDVNRIKKATGHSQETIDKYVADSNSEQLREVTRGQTSNTVTNKQIDEFVRAHGDDPKAIADAMKEYKVDLARIQQATGFSRDEMTNYINNSRDPNLKLALVDWPHEKTGNADFDKLPEFMKAGVFNGQPTVIIRDASEIDKLPIWSSMHPDAAAFYKKLLQERLDAGDASSTGMSVTGIMGYQIRIPDKGNPERTYPPTTAAEIAAMKAELSRIQEPAIAAQKKLITCLDAGKSDCANERKEYDLVRQPAINLSAKIQTEEFERTLMTTKNNNELFYASITPSLTAHNAFLQCTQTTKVTKASCDTQAELAIEMSKKVEALSKNVYEDCVKTYGGSDTPQCRPLYMQYDAQRTSASRLTQRINEFNAEIEARNDDNRVRSNSASTGSTTTPVASAPLTLTLPAEGKTRTLSKGHTISSDGVVKNSKGQKIAVLGKDGVFRGTDGKPVRAGTAQTLTKLVAEPAQSAPASVASNAAAPTKSAPIVDDSDNTAVPENNTDDSAEQKNAYVAETDKNGAFYGDNNSDLTEEVKKLKLPETAAIANKDGSIITNDEINSFIRANLNDPKAIANAMKKYGVDLNRIQEATGYTRDEMVDYINKSNNSYLKTALGKWTTDKSTDVAADAKISNAEVDNYIRSNLKDPAKIASAMLKHNISLDRVQLATGYSRSEITNYINKSRSPELKQMLANWKKSPTVSGVSDTDINNFIRGNLNNPAAIANAMKKYKVGLDRIQVATGYTHQEMVDYIKASNNAYLKAELAKWKAVKPIQAPKSKPIPLPKPQPDKDCGIDGSKCTGFPVPKSKPIPLPRQNPDEECGIDGSKCRVIPVPGMKPEPILKVPGMQPLPQPVEDVKFKVPGMQPLPQPVEDVKFKVPGMQPLPKPQVNPGKNCGINGSLCKRIPTNPKSKPIPLPKPQPDKDCGIDGSKCTGFPVPKSKPIPLPRQNPDEECGIDGSKCKPAPETY
jgi:uncharacterized alpha-E superfamily protein